MLSLADAMTTHIKMQLYSYFLLCGGMGECCVPIHTLKYPRAKDRQNQIASSLTSLDPGVKLISIIDQSGRTHLNYVNSEY